MYRPQPDDITVLILSCDRYRDTWEPVAFSYEQNWPDCPYPIRLLTNHQRFDHPRIASIAVGDDLDWSSNLLQMLEHVESERVMLWLDDVFIGQRVDNSAVRKIAIWAAEHDAAFVRLRPVPAPDSWGPDGVGELHRDASYRVSVFATLWKVSTLRAILRAGENPWQFEVDGTERSRAMSGFYATRRPVFHHVHGVEKGLWLRATVKWLRYAGVKVDLGYRRQMTRTEHVVYQLRRAKGLVMTFVPESRRKFVLRAADTIYRAVGLRRAPTA
jgi:hypothetical protein